VGIAPLRRRRALLRYLGDTLRSPAGHDDREQFLAGIDLILAGIATVK
jgi:hypothetical protein